MDEQGLRLDDIGGILRRRAKVVLAVTGVTFLGSVLLAALLPNQYLSYTTLLVEPRTVSKKLVEAGLDEGDLMNRLHLMTMQILSRARLSRVIDDLKLYPKLSAKKTREEVIQYMRDRIWVDPVLPELETKQLNRTREYDINTFRLYFRHEDSTTAAAVANRLTNDFIDEHIKDRVQVSGDTAEFIESELGRLSTRIREVEAQIAQVKTENAGSLPTDMEANQRQLERSFESLRDTQRRLAEADSDQAFYRQQAAVAHTTADNKGDLYGRAVTPALRLQELEMSLSDMRARGLTDKYPDVIAAQAEIEQLQGKVDEDDARGAPASAGEQEALAEAERARAKAEVAHSEVARVQGEIDQAQQRLAATPRVAEQLDALAREYKSLSENFTDYSNKRLEAGVAANMERRQKGEQFKVLEPAFPAADPVSPNRPLILLLGTLLGLVLGGGIGLLLEAADSSYHNPRSLQEALRIPVLAAIPSILLDVDRRALRRRRMREAIAALAVTGVVLLAAGVGYVYVNMPQLYGGAPASTAASPNAPRAPAPAAPSALPPEPAAAPAGDADGANQPG
jgi:polysaccharide chain length determinant protein (PEP-CTERM system associated)